MCVCLRPAAHLDLFGPPVHVRTTSTAVLPLPSPPVIVSPNEESNNPWDVATLHCWQRAANLQQGKEARRCRTKRPQSEVIKSGAVIIPSCPGRTEQVLLLLSRQAAIVERHSQRHLLNHLTVKKETFCLALPLLKFRQHPSSVPFR